MVLVVSESVVCDLDVIDAIEDDCFHAPLKAMAELFRKSSAAAHPGLRWSG